MRWAIAFPAGSRIAARFANHGGGREFDEAAARGTMSSVNRIGGLLVTPDTSDIYGKRIEGVRVLAQHLERRRRR
jgi:hypothetical protein